MAKGPPKNTSTIQRLLEERRQYEAWIARLNAAGDATPAHVRTRVQADYETRLHAVSQQLKVHAEQARQLIAERQEQLSALRKQEHAAAERLSETELRHAVGEYDESQWTQVHKDALAELVSVREELETVLGDIEQLQELDALARAKPPAQRRAAPPTTSPATGAPQLTKKPVDELAFIKSVTEDEAGDAPSPKRASGGQFQPKIPDAAPPPASVPAPSAQPSALSRNEEDEDLDGAKTLKCAECGTMNRATEWYCEECGAELSAL